MNKWAVILLAAMQSASVTAMELVVVTKAVTDSKRTSGEKPGERRRSAEKNIRTSSIPMKSSSRSIAIPNKSLQAYSPVEAKAVSPNGSETFSPNVYWNGFGEINETTPSPNYYSSMR